MLTLLWWTVSVYPASLKMAFIQLLLLKHISSNVKELWRTNWSCHACSFPPPIYLVHRLEQASKDMNYDFVSVLTNTAHSTKRLWLKQASLYNYRKNSIFWYLRLWCACKDGYAYVWNSNIGNYLSFEAVLQYVTVITCSCWMFEPHVNILFQTW